MATKGSIGYRCDYKYRLAEAYHIRIAIKIRVEALLHFHV